MRRQLSNLLLSVQLDLFTGVDWQDLIWINSHQDGASEGLNVDVDVNIDVEIIKDTKNTHVDEVVIVANEKVSQDSSFMKISETDHILHPLDRGGVHGLDPPLRGEPGLLPVIINHLDLPSLSSNNPGSDSDIKLSPGDGLNPDVVSLQQR